MKTGATRDPRKMAGVTFISGTAIVELRGLTMFREGQTILAGVSWRIERGRHWALLGANGSGKTTLLKTVTGYEWPSEGEVFVLGQRFGDCDLRELRKAVGWVSSGVLQQFPAHRRPWTWRSRGWMHPSAYIAICAGGVGGRRGGAGRVGMTGIAGMRVPAAFAGGTAARADRTGAGEPAGLLILDEPCRARPRGPRALSGGHGFALAVGGCAYHDPGDTPHRRDRAVDFRRAGAAKGTSAGGGGEGGCAAREVLSEAFGAKCGVEQVGERYYLRWENQS